MRTVLLIESEKLLLHLYTTLLEGCGYRVYTAISGGDAIELFKKNRPQVVVLCIKLEDIGGTEVLERLKAIDNSIPVILNSVYDYKWYKSDPRILLADDCLMKSPDVSGLLSKVKQYALKSNLLAEQYVNTV